MLRPSDCLRAIGILGSKRTKAKSCAERSAIDEQEAYYTAELHRLSRIMSLRDSHVPWQVCQHKDLPAPSHGEVQIINVLSMYDIPWYREVEFLDHKSSEHGYYRYDFYLPTLKTVLEYDGELYHTKENNIIIDNEKNRFCREVGIDMVRYNKKQFYRMDQCIGTLMSRYGIRKK